LGSTSEEDEGDPHGDGGAAHWAGGLGGPLAGGIGVLNTNLVNFLYFVLKPII